MVSSHKLFKQIRKGGGCLGVIPGHKGGGGGYKGVIHGRGPKS
jgi:hypothetical protein